MSTKREIIDLAFDEIGVSDYNFDRPVEQTQTALRRLNSMVGLWAAKGIVFCPSYPFPWDPVEVSPTDTATVALPFSDDNTFNDTTGFYNPAAYTPQLTNADIDLETNAPGWALEALFLNLAVRLAPAIGKQPSSDTKANAAASYSWVLGQYIEDVEYSMDGQPRGGAYKTPNYPFIHVDVGTYAEGDVGILGGNETGEVIGIDECTAIGTSNTVIR